MFIGDGERSASKDATSRVESNPNLLFDNQIDTHSRRGFDVHYYQDAEPVVSAQADRAALFHG